MATIPSLASPAELQAVRPGGSPPLPQDKIDAASDEVRLLAGWHIAPVIEEVLILDHHGGNRVWLPTRRVVEITKVENIYNEEPVELVDRRDYRWSADGWLEGKRFPQGARSLRITLSHGFEECPKGLLRTIANRTQRRIIQEGLGTRQVTFSEEENRGVEAMLDRFAVGTRA